MEDISILGVVGLPVIVICCLLIGAVCKNVEQIGDKWIPCICGFCGGVLGVIAMKVMPDFPAHDYLTAIAIGIVSGFGATGVHQAFFKQLRKDE